MNTPPFTSLVVIFFFSGFASILWEVVWMRTLSLYFGTSHYAVVSILCSFMAGLALGGYAGGKLERARVSPLLLFGLFEIVTGFYALLFRPLIRLSIASTTLLVSPEEIAGSPGLVFSLSALLLLFPTLLMGMTFPLIGSFVSPSPEEVGFRAGSIYSANLLGAGGGALATGFIFLPLSGLSGTTYIGCGLNLAVGISALLLHLSPRRGRGGPATSTAAERGGARRRVSAWFIPLLFSISLTSFSSMLYEVLYTRYLSGTIGSSVYSFTIILFSFLIALGAGSLLSAHISRGGVKGALSSLVACQFSAGIFATCTMLIFPLLPVTFGAIYRVSAGFWLPFIFLESLLCILLIFPSAFACGMAFPSGLKVMADLTGMKGRGIGILYAMATAGSIAGSLLSGFYMIPGLGLDLSLKTGAAVSILSSFFILPLLRVRKRTIPYLYVLGLTLLATIFSLRGIHPLSKMTGIYYYIERMAEAGKGVRLGFLNPGDYRLLYYREGAASSVMVCLEKASGVLWLSSNGKVEASTDIDLPTQILMGHIPFLFHPARAEDVMVIGLASGITAGTALLHRPESMDIVEIEPAMEEASSYFSGLNNEPLKGRGVRLITGDARSLLTLSEKTYDIIISEPSNPWITGVSNLFTLEFLQEGRKRLKENGIFCQWIQVYSIFEEDLKSLLATFREVFPKGLVLSTLTEADIILLGFKDGYPPELGLIEERLRDREVTRSLKRAGIHDLTHLLSLVILDEKGLVKLTKGAVLNTDDNMRIEFSAPMSLYAETVDSNFLLLMEKSDGPINFLLGLRDISYRGDLFVDMGETFIKRGMPILALKSAEIGDLFGYSPDALRIYREAESLLKESRRGGWTRSIRGVKNLNTKNK